MDIFTLNSIVLYSISVPQSVLVFGREKNIQVHGLIAIDGATLIVVYV